MSHEHDFREIEPALNEAADGLSVEERRRFDELLQRVEDLPSNEQSAQAWDGLVRELGLTTPEKSRSNAPKLHSWSGGIASPRRARRTPWLVAAGSIVTAIAAVLTFLMVRPKMPAVPTSSAPIHEYTTKNAQRAEIRLADGTRVVLAPTSRLVIPSDFGGKTRTLTLEGEAYFDVVHDTTRPFTVRSSRTVTRDVGTAFAITDYSTDAQARVVVAEGAVALLAPKDTMASTLQLLSPGDMARVTRNGSITTSKTDVSRRLAWLRSGLTFDDVPLDEAVREIGRWYDLDITLADPSLASRRLVATIGDEPADHVLNLVTASLKLRFERNGKAVTIHPIR